MAGPYANQLYSTTNNYAPIQDGAAVTPNDGTDLPGGVTRAIFVGGAGTISLDLASGNTISLTIPATACGVVQYLAVKRVRATGTTATGIVALY